MPPVLTPAVRWSLVVTGELLLVLYSLAFGNTFDSTPEVHRVNLLILGSLGGLGWLTVATRPSRLPTILVVAPLPVLAALVLTALLSAYPSLSWYAVWHCAAYIGIAWLLEMQAIHPTGRRNLMAVMALVATVVIGVYLVYVAASWAEWLSLGFPISSLPLRPRLTGGLVPISTWVGDVMALCVPVASVWLWRIGGGTSRGCSGRLGHRCDRHFGNAIRHLDGRDPVDRGDRARDAQSGLTSRRDPGFGNGRHRHRGWSGCDPDGWA